MSDTRAIQLKEEALTEVSFGEWLKRQRSARGLTQEQLAHQIGCAAVTLRKIEAEERRPSAQMAERMADILDIPQNERTSFLRYARGELRYAPEESAPDTPWHASPVSPRSNLPAPPSSLIGREQVIAEIHQYLMQADIRLVTLIGPPGIGKTRLSIESARQSLADFPYGVFFVALAPLDDPRLVAPTIVQTLGFVEARRQSAMEQLQQSIGEKQMLLVLDNCEHLIEEVAALVSALLSGCPRLKIVTTSRESLRIPGEWLYSVPTLNIPKEYSVMDVETALNFPAVALFVERARAVRPDFSLTINNVQTIAAICAELDGLPLAIELIAARLRLMSPEALLARLNDQFTLYADGMRAPSVRQKTLNNAISWSFDLLSAEEQRLFSQLSVFSGGFTLDAAEAIFSRSVGSKSVAELMALLLDKSLLQRTVDEGQGEARFDMLTVIQQFALDRLRKMGAEAETRDWHLDYFLSLAEKAEPLLTSAQRPIWLEQLRRDYDNIRAALTWGQGSEMGLRLVGALRWFWDFVGMVAEGRNWAERVLEASDERNTASRAKALWSAGSMAWHQGDYAAAHPWLEESARIWRSLIAQSDSEGQQRNMKQGLARALRKLGNLAYSEKNFMTANSLKEESIALFREVGPRWDLALDLRVFGQLLAERQEFELARTTLAESASLFQQENDPWGIGIASIGLASLDLRLNDFEQANKHLKESITAILQSPNLATIARCLALLGIVAAKEQQPKRAAQLFGAADKILEDEGLSGLSQQILYPGMIEEGIQTARQQLDEQDFAREWAKGRTMTVEQAISYALEDSSS